MEGRAMVYRVVLRGFADIERTELEAFLRDTRERDPGYECVPLQADNDVIVANADSAAIVAEVVGKDRVASTLFLGENRPPMAIWHVPLPTHPARLLLGLDELVSQFDTVPAPPPQRADAATVARRRAKALARQAARRALQASLAAADASSPVPPDALVLDADDGARDQLCKLLDQIGFCAYPARDIGQASWLLNSRAFRAAFLDVALDENDAPAVMALCQLVKSNALNPPGHKAALLIVTGDTSPVHRVLATLAGSDALLAKPFARDAVIRSLESCGVLLPQGER
jgi:CheY-like chemotaxis protein